MTRWTFKKLYNNLPVMDPSALPKGIGIVHQTLIDRIYQLENELEDADGPELDACPFCGCSEVEVRRIGRSIHGYYIACASCGASGPYGGTLAEAAELWGDVAARL